LTGFLLFFCPETGDRNPRAHILLTMRALGDNGLYSMNAKRVRDTSLRKFIMVSGKLFVAILSLCTDTGSACYVTRY